MNRNEDSFSFSRPVFELKAAKTFEYLNMASKLAKEGRKVISFGIGQPDFNTPKHIVDAAITALRGGFTRYVSPPGIPELRQEIARYVSDFTGAGDIKAEETLVTAGAKQAMFFAIVSLIKPGDEVIIPDPSFYSYTHITRYAGGKPVFIPLKEERNFTFSLEDLQAALTDKTKMIIINSPHNPTGAMINRSELNRILEFVKEKGLIVVSDEIYDHYVYEQQFLSVVEDSDWRDYAIYINSFSKTYAMPGWRLGYMVAGKKAIERCTLFTTNTLSCTTSFVQKAGIAALTGPQDFFQKVIRDYKERRSFLYNELNSIPGIRTNKPEGAFYFFPNIKKILEEKKMSTEEFAIHTLNETGVVILPGSAFPNNSGHGYLRLSYALPLETLKVGLEKFKTLIQKEQST